MHRLAAVDAQSFWTSTKIPNDQFLLYGFAGVPADLDAVLAGLRDRAQRCPDFTVRIDDRNPLTYPAWVPRDVAEDQFVVHDLDSPSWSECLIGVAELGDDQLEPMRSCWRLHVFPEVSGIPGSEGAGTVVVLQMIHALADGIRSSELAAWLFGRPEPVAVVSAQPFVGATLGWRAVRAALTYRQLVRDTEAGLVAPQADSRPIVRSNARPEGRRWVRTITRRRHVIAGPTVTVGVLSAVSAALAEYLRQLGDDVAALGAEVPMAKSAVRQAYNNFGNVGIGLHPDLESGARMACIAGELAQRRQRSQHPAMAAAGLAFAASPAPLLRWGITQFDPTVRSDMVTGNTVVSSVNRGAADLRFGDAPVVMTAGYPALSPMMGLTHGVHGIGDTVAVSVHAAESAVGDIDSYVELLDRALGD